MVYTGKEPLDVCAGMSWRHRIATVHAAELLACGLTGYACVGWWEVAKWNGPHPSLHLLTHAAPQASLMPPTHCIDVGRVVDARAR